MRNQPLALRYRNDGRTIINLTELQREARDKILAKILKGEYKLGDVPCPACNSQQCRLLSEKDMYGLPMSVVLCRDCNIVYTSPRLTDEALTSFYDGEYRQLDRALPQEDDLFQLEWGKGELIFKYLAENALLDRVTNKLVVEIGCGAGGILAYFREQGYTILGFDLGRQYLEYGISQYGLDLYWGDLKLAKHIIAQRGLSAGLFIYEQVLEHVPYPKNELFELQSIMTPDSILYISVPGLRNIDAHYDSDFLRYLQIPHLLHFDLASLTRVLGMCRFSRVVGDERVRAVFEVNTAAVDQVSEDRDSSDILAFLLALERRWRVKTSRKVLRQLSAAIVRSTGSRAKLLLEKSPFPQPLQQKIIVLLRQLVKAIRI